ncbi:MAG TPA: cyclic nucleotide-binding domain-containing protein [Puia sp.]|nr:cyclic nucleotide-binding domain-containing protein [Puia sp.]
MEELFRLFDDIQLLSPDLRNYLISKLIPLKIAKKTTIQEEGQIADRIYFIEKGLVRAVRMEKGKPKTAWIMNEGNIIVSVESFFLGIPSVEQIETLEDCEFQSFLRKDLYKAYEDYPEFNLHRAVILERYYPLAEFRNRMRQMKAEDKFKFLLLTQPELVTRKSAKDKLLASYLGITPGTFSLQKNRFANGHKATKGPKKKKSAGRKRGPNKGKKVAKKVAKKAAKKIRNRKKK